MVLAVLLAACGGGDGGGGEEVGGGAAAPTTAETTDDEASGEPTAGGELIVATEAAWLPVDPLTMGALTDRTVGSAVYDTLVGISPEGELEPMLAESWDSEDAVTYVVVLREGVTFHDGTPLDAEAVVKHFERLRDPANQCRCIGELSIIDTIVASGPLEVTFTLKTASAGFPTLLSDVSGMIVSPTAVETMGDGFANAPVGAGPFKFVEQLENDHITFERYDGYWEEGKPLLDRITYRPIPDADARYASLRSGDVDVIASPSVDHQVAAAEEPDLQVVEVGGIGTTFSMMNTQRAPFDKVEARQAVAYATDVQTLIDTLYEGRYEQVRSPFPPDVADVGDPPNYPDYDLEKAKALVEELGGLSFTYSLTNSPGTLQLGQALQGMWQEAGMEVTLTPLEQTVLITNAIDHEFQAMNFRWAGRFDPDANSWQFFHSSSPRNYTLTEDAEIDELLDAARQELDPDKRLELYTQFSERLAEVMPYSFLWTNSFTFIASNEVHDIPPQADALLRPHGIWIES